MVMETPSPQCVGREFVRQYYTLLHEAPDYLHRFYSHNSSFVHGGVEKPGEEHPPVMGQADIHKKIVSLNFRDCHAKIRQVDSQATVGNAVVVQVTGELSNCGQPMRRFMQTFVLAPQSPKKYYVHNDIFRYQDEVFHDSDGDGDAPEEATGTSYVDSDTDLMEEEAGSNGTGEHIPAEQTTTYYNDIPSQQPVLSNGDAHLDEAGESVEETDDKEVLQPPQAPEVEDLTPAADEAPVTDMFTANVDDKVEKTPEPEPVEESQPEVVKQHSWASIISSGSKSSGISAPASSVQQPAAPTSQPVKQPHSTGPSPVSSGKQDFNKSEQGGQGPQPQRAPRPQRNDRPRERDNSRGGGIDNEEGRIRSRFPDSHQLFVGNLPHSISEKELKLFFEQFGTVVDVRINRKSAPRDVPNFGFVVFDNPDSVQQVLEQKPIVINGDHRLNVEEKKQRSEQSGRPGSGTRAGGGGRGSGGPPGRGSSGSMGGMSRGGGRAGAPMPRSATDNRTAVGGTNRGPRR